MFLKYKKLLIIFIFSFLDFSFYCFPFDLIDIKNKGFVVFLNSFEEKTNNKEQLFFVKSILNDIVDSIKKRDFYFNPKIKSDFLNILNQLDVFKKIKLRDFRRFKKDISDYDSYLEKYLDSLSLFLNDKEKVFIQKIRFFNNSVSLLLDNFDGINFNLIEKIEDVAFFRPLEFIINNKKILGCTAITAGALSYYYFLYPKFKEKNKKNRLFKGEQLLASRPLILENKNKTFEIRQIYVNTQREEECALHAVWNSFLGLISDNVEQFRENELRYLPDFYEWVERTNQHFDQKNWFDDGQIEDILVNEDLIPDFVNDKRLDEIKILRALPNGPDNFLRMHAMVGSISQDVYSSAILDELGSSVDLFRAGTSQNLILLINRHFVNLKLKRVDGLAGGVEAWVTNSLRNHNYTNHYAINNVLTYYLSTLSD
ncbi:MAG: hypothetical protein ABIF12_01840 [bacterium]